MHDKKFVHSRAKYLSKIIQRPLLFLHVGDLFHLFPPGFNPCTEKTSYRVRGKWNYLLMIRFWFKIVHELPQLSAYEYIMRLDDDSQLTSQWFNIFDEMRRKDAVYFANNVDIDLEEQLPGTMLLEHGIMGYIQNYRIVVKQPDILRHAFSNGTVRNYYNNFEVTKLDAVLRYLTLAIFAEQREVLHRLDYNLFYCHKC